MQTTSEAPKSYSLIKNLLPSVSLCGQISQGSDNEQNSDKIQQNSEITQEVNNICEVVQHLDMDQLNITLSSEIMNLQQFFSKSQSTTQTITESFLDIEDSMTLKLKQILLLSQMVKQRMSEKFNSSKLAIEQYKAKYVKKHRSMNFACYRHGKKTQRRSEKERNLEEKRQKSAFHEFEDEEKPNSQKTEKKLSKKDEEENYQEESDKKKTKRGDKKGEKDL